MKTIKAIYSHMLHRPVGIVFWILMICISALATLRNESPHHPMFWFYVALIIIFDGFGWPAMYWIIYTDREDRERAIRRENRRNGFN